jgi:hypothetical protein
MGWTWNSDEGHKKCVRNIGEESSWTADTWQTENDLL